MKRYILFGLALAILMGTSLAQNVEAGNAEAFRSTSEQKGPTVQDGLDWLKEKFGINNINTRIDTDTMDIWLALGADENGSTIEVRISVQQTAEDWYSKGVASDQQGKHDEALQAFDRAIAINPQFALAWYKKGHTLFNQSKYDEAIQAYNKVIEIAPQHAEIWNDKGVVLNNQGKYDEAIQVLNKAIELDPQFALAWYNKGLALSDQGKYDEALKAYDEAIRLNPDFAKAWYAKGAALEAQSNTAAANAALAKAKELGYTG